MTQAYNRVNRLLAHLSPEWEVVEVETVEVGGKGSSEGVGMRREQMLALRKWLDGPYHELKDKVREHVRNTEIFHSKLDETMTLAEERKLALERMRAYYAPQWISPSEMARNVEIVLAVGEPANWVDMSLATKAGAHAFLFGGALALLGSEEQQERMLPAAARLETIGCFAMTERGHGSNVRSLETVAEYDQESGEFVINTPSDSAEKWYIGNALSAQMAAVFAQLIVDGENHGPHVFAVPIRDEEGRVVDGVTVTDNGTKGGINGVDNGRLRFKDVRVPRLNMLSRFGYVDERGRYSSPVSNVNKRFFDMLSALTPTRCAVVLSAIAALKVGHNVAIRYAHKRRQFAAKKNAAETRLIDYSSHRLLLLPDLATNFALVAALRAVIKQWHGRSLRTERQVVAHVSGLKAYATWLAVDSLQRCRECCGGAGFLAVNQLVVRRAAADVGTTWEGSNGILVQVVAKYALDRFMRPILKGNLGAVGSVLATAIRRSINYNLSVWDYYPSDEEIMSSKFVLNAWEFAEQCMVADVAVRLRSLMGSMGRAKAWNQCLPELNEVAMVHMESVIAQHFVASIKSLPKGHLRTTLRLLFRLHSMHRLHQRRAWFVEQRYFNPHTSRRLLHITQNLADKVQPISLDLVESFGVPDEVLGAPIACDDSVF